MPIYFNGYDLTSRGGVILIIGEDINLESFSATSDAVRKVKQAYQQALPIWLKNENALYACTSISFLQDDDAYDLKFIKEQSGYGSIKIYSSGDMCVDGECARVIAEVLVDSVNPDTFDQFFIEVKGVNDDSLVNDEINLQLIQEDGETPFTFDGYTPCMFNGSGSASYTHTNSGYKFGGDLYAGVFRTAGIHKFYVEANLANRPLQPHVKSDLIIYEWPDVQFNSNVSTPPSEGLSLVPISSAKDVNDAETLTKPFMAFFSGAVDTSSAFEGNQYISYVTFPTDLCDYKAQIGASSFCNCSNLKTIVFQGSGYLSVADNNFSNSIFNDSTIIFNCRDMVIGNGAFSTYTTCSPRIEYYGLREPTIGQSAFNGISLDTVVHVCSYYQSEKFGSFDVVKDL